MRRWVIVLDNTDDADFLLAPSPPADGSTATKPRIEYIPTCDHGTVFGSRCTSPPGAGKRCEGCSAVSDHLLDRSFKIAIVAVAQYSKEIAARHWVRALITPDRLDACNMCGFLDNPTVRPCLWAGDPPPLALTIHAMI